MSAPFPGMNPYLEHPDRWSTVHNKLIVAIADALTPQLLPRYQVDIEKRIYEVMGFNSLLVGRADVSVQQPRRADSTAAAAQAVAIAPQPKKVSLPVPEEIREAYLEVREAATQRVVTIIEVLSPTNKKGSGRQKYLDKRQNILTSQTHLVEIDLLREGESLPMQNEDDGAAYRILVSRAEQRPMADLYSFGVSEAIPRFPVPVVGEDAEPWLDLKLLLDGIYARSGYGVFIDYSDEPQPRLEVTEQAWLEAYLEAEGLRRSSKA